VSDHARSVLAACETINGWSSGSSDETAAAADDAARHIRERLATWWQPLDGGSPRGAAHRYYDASVKVLCDAALRIHAARSAEIEAARGASPASIGGRSP
jgi:hypothetical protein